MQTRQLAEALGLVLAVVFLVGTASSAQARPARHTPPAEAPACTPWPLNGGRKFWPSPAFQQDQTLFTSDWEYADPAHERERFYILRSSDGGRSWLRWEPANLWVVYDLAFSPDYAHDRTVCAASNALFCSTDAGLSWASAPFPPDGGYGPLPSLVMTGPRSLFLGLRGGPPGVASFRGLFYSADAGATWEKRVPGFVDSVAVSPAYAEDHTVLISFSAYHFNGGIAKSTDGGYSWAPSREGLEWGADGQTIEITFSPDYPADQTVFCLSWDAPYKSTDAGAHWTRLDPHDPSLPWGNTRHYVVSPHFSRDQTLWLEDSVSGDSLMSTDGGATWQGIAFNIRPLAAMEAYCPQGGDCGIELIGYRSKIDEALYYYKSFDGGQTWDCLETAVTPTPTPPAPPAEIPEPATWLLVGGGLAILAKYCGRQADHRRGA